jgi:hypothetical protein
MLQTVQVKIQRTHLAGGACLVAGSLALLVASIGASLDVGALFAGSLSMSSIPLALGMIRESALAYPWRRLTAWIGLLSIACFSHLWWVACLQMVRSNSVPSLPIVVASLASLFGCVVVIAVLVTEGWGVVYGMRNLPMRDRALVVISFALLAVALGRVAISRIGLLSETAAPSLARTVSEGVMTPLLVSFGVLGLLASYWAGNSSRGLAKWIGVPSAVGYGVGSLFLADASARSTVEASSMIMTEILLGVVLVLPALLAAGYEALSTLRAPQST